MVWVMLFIAQIVLTIAGAARWKHPLPLYALPISLLWAYFRGATTDPGNATTLAITLMVTDIVYAGAVLLFLIRGPRAWGVKPATPGTPAPQAD